MKNPAMQNLGVRITIDQFEKLNTLADKNGETVSDTVRQILAEHFQTEQRLKFEKLEHEATRQLIKNLFLKNTAASILPEVIVEEERQEIDWLQVFDELPEEGGLFRRFLKEARTEHEKRLVEDLLWCRFEWKSNDNKLRSSNIERSLRMIEELTTAKPMDTAPKFPDDEEISFS